MSIVVRPYRGEVAGVPFEALPPAGDTATVAVVIAWPGLGPPRTARSLAAALPLRAVDAWRVYLDLSGPDPEAVAGAFPAVLAALAARLPLDGAPVGLLGAGTGAAVAHLVATDLPVRAVAAVNPVAHPAVVARLTAVPPDWSSLVVVTGGGQRAAADELWYTLSQHDPERSALVTLPTVGPALAPQTPDAARVDQAVTDWFRRTLTARRGQPPQGRQ